MPRVIVVGGGYAGASAATAMAEAGLEVQLLESRGQLGGRVYSTPASENFPAPVDNGPHLFMGCYRETLRFLKRLGAGDSFHWIDPLKLSWLAPGGKKISLNCPPLPAPLHLGLGLLFSNAFPWGEKIPLAEALFPFSKKPFRVPPDLRTVGQYLDYSHQGPLARERFWNPLTRSVMNLDPALAPLQGLGEVLNRIFFGRRSDSSFGISAKPLSEIGFPLVPEYLSSRGGTVQFHEGIQSFRIEGDQFELVGRSGNSYRGDALLWAVPPTSLAALWPKDTWTFADHFKDLGKSPIVSIHVILSRKVLEGHFQGLSGARFEWVFNRNDNWGWRGEGADSSMESAHPKRVSSLEPRGQGQYLSFTASAAGDLAGMKDPELLALAIGELTSRVPKARDIEVLHSKVTREMAATFVWSLETDGLRPSCETPFHNVFLAGDWTNTGLPATIEGACLSGHQAAGKILDYYQTTPSAQGEP